MYRPNGFTVASVQSLPADNFPSQNIRYEDRRPRLQSPGPAMLLSRSVFRSSFILILVFYFGFFLLSEPNGPRAPCLPTDYDIP